MFKKLSPLFLSLSLLTTLSFAQTSYAQAPVSCQLLLQASPSAEADNLKNYLSGPFGTSDVAVIHPIGHRNGKVVFVKNKNDMWVSRHEAIEHSLTAEGDVRLPIFLLGPELAAKLGYAIREIGNNEIEIEVPDAELLALKVAKINSSLKS